MEAIFVFLLRFFLFVLPLFLILLVLIQRGKGGGLAGAFGGMGGQSAFGAKAGDFFMVVTIVVAAIWIVVCAFSVWYFGLGADLIQPSQSEEEEDFGAVPAGSSEQPVPLDTPQPATPSSPQPSGV